VTAGRNNDQLIRGHIAGCGRIRRRPSHFRRKGPVQQALELDGKLNYNQCASCARAALRGLLYSDGSNRRSGAQGLSGQVGLLPSGSILGTALGAGLGVAAAAEFADKDAEPSVDRTGSAEYRAHLVRVLTRRALRSAAGI
jgi:hypothetical protein